jgi:hypothetical protein
MPSDYNRNFYQIYKINCKMLWIVLEYTLQSCWSSPLSFVPTTTSSFGMHNKNAWIDPWRQSYIQIWSPNERPRSYPVALTRWRSNAVTHELCNCRYT